MVLRCLWGTTSLCLRITHLVCDFHIILRIWDSSRPHSNTLLGKASDLLGRVWLIWNWRMALGKDYCLFSGLTLISIEMSPSWFKGMGEVMEKVGNNCYESVLFPLLEYPWCKPDNMPGLQDLRMVTRERGNVPLLNPTCLSFSFFLQTLYFWLLIEK